MPTTVNYYAGPIGDKGRHADARHLRAGSVDDRPADAEPGICASTTSTAACPRWSSTPAPWVPARSFPEVKDVPNWKDVNPRVGAAYDLFGTGRTAIKGFLGRYRRSSSRWAASSRRTAR